MTRLLLSFALAASLAACAADPPAAASSASGQSPSSGAVAAPSGARAGTVVEIFGDQWGIVPEGEPTQRYCFDGPLATTALRVEGKKIHFSGTAGAIPPNARLACTPFTLGAATAD